MVSRTRVTRILSRLNILATLGAAGAATHAVITGNWRWLAASGEIPPVLASPGGSMAF